MPLPFPLSFLFFLFQPPEPRSTRNGVLIGYDITYSTLGGPESSVASTLLQHDITGLLPQTTYSIRVAAKTSAGVGPASNTTLVTTAATGSPTPSTNGKFVYR